MYVCMQVCLCIFLQKEAMEKHKLMKIRNVYKK